MALANNCEEILLRPQGCLDLRGGRWLQQQLESIAPRRYKFWVVDLSSVEFIDSSGLVALVGGLNAATQAGARLILCGLRPSAQLIFDITQLDRVFTIFETYEALLASLSIPEEVSLL
ncbi:STAS domain-containing protein [Myxacorys almedinensis]|uniref:Anti-sigma factor antagonist n=1 Tax=Myxacorys almedinensis A TaxID=2690445 RepID=A0A8J8CIM2_9CYAN|nr:STAS domain-containing protein [Myxacorys almedinensis]NDJ16701.1 anti-sigma factor antagonist [Myxacorys almedinensis A]